LLEDPPFIEDFPSYKPPFSLGIFPLKPPFYTYVVIEDFIICFHGFPMAIAIFDFKPLRVKDGLAEEPRPPSAHFPQVPGNSRDVPFPSAKVENFNQRMGAISGYFMTLNKIFTLKFMCFFDFFWVGDVLATEILN